MRPSNRLLMGATTFSITAPSITTSSIKGLFVTMSTTTLFNYAECYILLTVVLNAIMLSVMAPISVTYTGQRQQLIEHSAIDSKSACSVQPPLAQGDR